MLKKLPVINTLWSKWSDYELLDSGQGKKLERFGKYKIIRSEPRAWWDQDHNESSWTAANASFEATNKRGRWTFKQSPPTDWQVTFEGIPIHLACTATSKHVGVFPEQAPFWHWLKSIISKQPRQLNILNLFGYTGVASLVAAKADAKVTHVDASRTTISWARRNQSMANLNRASIRWILDDALKFVQREKRRERKYDGIILDPPAFGRGPQGQVWRLEKDLRPLLSACSDILSEQALFTCLTSYAIEASSLTLGNILADTVASERTGQIDVGEFVLRPNHSPKLLPMSLFACWRSPSVTDSIVK